ncbi:tetratricopeptide repeat protein [Thalassoroseus pseudoceratinae]|uniref:tetratricopeptide repeat protein n=1 Tax=Thalassoroseus pseudoceratinae TaxID=2713176 RepID=UPI001421051A|nr:tetratricopeptide repeat protein [Thalassoroseus pseudoceratinae]
MSTAPTAESCLREGRARLKAKDIDEAIRFFEAGLALDPDAIKLHDGLGAAHYMRKDFANAAKCFQRIIELDPQNGRAFTNLGAVYNRLGEFPKAVEALRKGVQREKTSVGFYNLGIAQKNIGQVAMAVSAYQQAVRLDPLNADAYLNLANCLVEMKNVRKAVESYQKALEIRPDFEAAKQGLAKAKSDQTAAREEIDPFGRLVSDSSHSGVIESFGLQEMTELQRLEDRQKVHDLCQNIQEKSSEVLEFLREQLSPSLHGLVRGTAAVGQSTKELQAAHDDYQTVLTDLISLRQRMKKQLLALRAHEELIHTPDIDDVK